MKCRERLRALTAVPQPAFLNCARIGPSYERPDPAQKLQRNNLSCPIQTPYIIRIAGNYKVSPLPGDDHGRRVDNIRSPRGAAEFSGATGKLVVRRNNLNLLAPQEPR